MPSLPLLTLPTIPRDWGQDKAASEGVRNSRRGAQKLNSSPGLRCLTFTLGGNTLHRARVGLKRNPAYCQVETLETVTPIKRLEHMPAAYRVLG